MVYPVLYQHYSGKNIFFKKKIALHFFGHSLEESARDNGWKFGEKNVLENLGDDCVNHGLWFRIEWKWVPQVYPSMRELRRQAGCHSSQSFIPGI